MSAAENSVFQEYLLPDEHVQWTGVPQFTLRSYLSNRIGGGVRFAIFGLLVVLLFATKSLGTVLLYGIAIAIFASLIFVAAAFPDLRKIRAGKVVVYGVTDKRLLFWYQGQFQSLFLNQLPGMALIKHNGQIGSIQFAYAQPVTFYRITNVETVYQQIMVLSEQRP